jgi:hypothetical protein
MPRQIPRVVGLIAFIAMLFVLSVDVGLPNAAPADDCLTAPRSPAPQGTHWYYRMDRTNQRKCWYVRAPGQPAQQAPALSASDPATAASTHSMPAPSGRKAATSAASGPGNSAPPLPPVRILAVKPKLAAVVSATTDKSGSEQEGSTEPSIPEAPAPKASRSSWPDGLPTVATGGASERSTVVADASAESVGAKTGTEVPYGAEISARGDKATVNAGTAGSLTPAPMVLALALGLVAAGAASGVVMKIVAARRAIVMIDHPEADWVDDQWQPERRNDQEHAFADELQEGESVTSGASNYESLHPLGEGRSFQMNEITKREDTLAQLSRNLHKALFVGAVGPGI